MQLQLGKHLPSLDLGCYSFSFKVIGRIYSSSKTTVSDVERKIRDPELFWFVELWSVSPFGLSNNVMLFGNVTLSQNTCNS